MAASLANFIVFVSVLSAGTGVVGIWTVNACVVILSSNSDMYFSIAFGSPRLRILLDTGMDSWRELTHC